MSEVINSSSIFKNYFQEFKETLVKNMSVYEMPEYALKYVDHMIEYNVFGGKLNRGISVLDTLLILKQNPSQDDIKKACCLGWCLEWLQAFFLVSDDIMDQSEMRRDKPCWYKVKGVRLNACNDYIMLNCHLYKLLDLFFFKDENHSEYIRLFLETTYQTCLGQLLDVTSTPPDSPLNLNLFTIERYQKIVKYKTAYYSFHLPILLGLFVSGVITNDNKQQLFAETEEITIPMGEYFQIQDDFLDCFGQNIGKIGRDIEEKKCGWLVVQALGVCNPEQRKVLDECYGIDDKEKVSQVKKLYEQLNLREVYRNYEEKTIKILKERIAKCSLNPKIFLSLLSKIEVARE